MNSGQDYSGDNELFESEELGDDGPPYGMDECSNPDLVHYDFDSLPLEECGTGFLRNGDVAELDSFPWISQFVYRNGKWYCNIFSQL